MRIRHEVCVIWARWCWGKRRWNMSHVVDATSDLAVTTQQAQLALEKLGGQCTNLEASLEELERWESVHINTRRWTPSLWCPNLEQAANVMLSSVMITTTVRTRQMRHQYRDSLCPNYMESLLMKCIWHMTYDAIKAVSSMQEFIDVWYLYGRFLGKCWVFQLRKATLRWDCSCYL